MRRAGLLALVALALLLAPSASAHAAPTASSHYLPQIGDSIVFQEYTNLSGGYGNYSGSTVTNETTGYLNITTTPANLTDKVTYVYFGTVRVNGSAPTAWGAKGSFTFSARTYRYVRGTDDQVGLGGSGEWFYTNSSASVGSSFTALDYELTVRSTSTPFGLHHGSSGYVDAIYAVSNGTYTYGNFTAAFVWQTYYDPSTGYLLGYVYTEQDLDGRGDGFVYTNVLHDTETSFTPAPAHAPSTYSVVIDEVGLGTSPSWTLVFDGTTYSESAPTVAFPGVANGTYLYGARAAGYSTNAPYGWVLVAGRNAEGAVAFTANPSSGSNPWLLYAVVGVVLLVIVVLLVYLALRHRRSGPRLPRHAGAGQVSYAPLPPGAPPPPISLSPGDQPRIQQVVVKEVVKVNCRYCGSLIDSTAEKCPFCGATRS